MQNHTNKPATVQALADI